MKSTHIKKLTLSALFLALGFLLPFLTGQIPAIGQMLLPMHLPVFLCAFLCDWRYGTAIGFSLPLARSFFFSVPVLYPTALAVAWEMATYGVVAGLLYHRLQPKSLKSLYASLLTAMIAGRVVRAFAELLLLHARGNSFVWKTFFTATVLYGIPGVLLQLTVIPSVMLLWKAVRITNKA